MELRKLISCLTQIPPPILASSHDFQDTTTYVCIYKAKVMAVLQKTYNCSDLTISYLLQTLNSQFSPDNSNLPPLLNGPAVESSQYCEDTVKRLIDLLIDVLVKTL